MVEPVIDLSDEDRQLFPSSLTIRALRDSRYRNTAYAVSELIDNSIEASAEQIEILCQEKPESVKSRQVLRLSEVAILDNGEGMGAKTLINALKFGGGTRHNSAKGIGKYGMGLPTSSMSQCRRVDVWTWQNGPESVLHAGIDADEIEQGDYLVPLPDQESIPEVWMCAGSQKILSGKSGTLIVWSKLDKIQWKKADTLVNHTAAEVGRIHRHYINEDIIRIRAACFHHNRPEEFTYEKQIVANDPLYLMRPTSTPEPWDNEAMFEQWQKKSYPVTIKGRENTIEVEYSIVKAAALQTDLPTQQPGSMAHGKHARQNIGVSVVREDREIVLEEAFRREGGSSENPENRWWGCQVSFFRDCDDIFGVDHNKQMAAHFTEAARTLARDDRSREEILEDLGIEDRHVIYEIVGDIRDQTRAMMRAISKMYEQKRKSGVGKRQNPAKKAARTATDADEEAIAAGAESPTKTDEERKSQSPEERMAGIAENLIRAGHEDIDARELSRILVEENLSYQFIPDHLTGSLMFEVRPAHGVLHIHINIDHPVYALLKYVEKDINEGAEEDDPAYVASVAIRLLLLSWARMEDQTESKGARTRIQDISMDWGRQVDKMINRFREKED